MAQSCEPFTTVVLVDPQCHRPWMAPGHVGWHGHQIVGMKEEGGGGITRQGGGGNETHVKGERM